MSTTPIRHEAEVLALAAIANASTTAFLTVSVDPDLFAGPYTNHVAKAVASLASCNRDITLPAISDELKRMDLASVMTQRVLWEVGAARLFPSAHSGQVKTLLDRLKTYRDTAEARVKLEGALEAVERGEIPELVSLTRSVVEAGVKDTVQTSLEFLSFLTDMWSGKIKSLFIESGFPEFNEETGGGWRRKALNVVAARPGGGKSSMMEQEALRLAESGFRVLFLPLEMGTESHLGRMIRREGYAQIKASGGLDFERKAISPGAQAVVSEIVMTKLQNQNLFWAEPVWNIQSVIPSITSAVRDKKIDVVIIDYFQLLVDTSYRVGANRNLELASIAKSLLACAKQTNTAFLLCAKMNREIERNGGDVREPRLSDIADCGEMEYFTHNAIIFRRNGEPDHNDVLSIDGFIVKARSGRMGCLKFKYHGPSMKFSTVVY